MILGETLGMILGETLGITCIHMGSRGRHAVRVWYQYTCIGAKVALVRYCQDSAVVWLPIVLPSTHTPGIKGAYHYYN